MKMENSVSSRIFSVDDNTIRTDQKKKKVKNPGLLYSFSGIIKLLPSFFDRIFSIAYRCSTIAYSSSSLSK